MTTISIPQSLYGYHTDRMIRSVVDSLLEQKASTLPVDMEWDDLETYYEAWLSARKVKVDKALFLKKLWEVVWKPLLEDHTIWSIEEMVEGAPDINPTLEIIWDDGFYCGHIIHSNQSEFYIQTYISIKASEGVQIGIKIYDENGNRCLPDRSELSNVWTEEDEESWYMSKDKLLMPTKNSTEIDVSELISMANEILTIKFLK